MNDWLRAFLNRNTPPPQPLPSLCRDGFKVSVKGGRWGPMLYNGKKPRRSSRVLRHEMVKFIMAHNITRPFDAIVTVEQDFTQRPISRWHIELGRTLNADTN